MAVLLAELPELGRLDRRRIAALVGVAPMNHDSGKLRGHAPSWAGERRAMHSIHGYLECRALNVVVKAFYQRLVALGKRKKVALGLHAKNADHPQYHGKASYMLES